MKRLSEQVAIITGAAQGIGRAAAVRLSEEGAKVLVVDLNVEKGKTVAGTLRAAGNTAEFFEADVGRHEDIRDMVNRAADLWGRIDILVNNAYSRGPGAVGNAVNVTEEAWDKGMAVLAKAIFLGAKYSVPEMQKIGSGSIINVSSVHGMLMSPDRLVYEAGKSAVIGMTRQMAIDFGPTGIRVNAVCPGAIETEVNPLRERNPSLRAFIEDQYPLRKVGSPDDIANAIVFLCSKEASFITGHALVVDGGLTIQLQEDFGIRQAHYLQKNPDTHLS